MLRTLLANLLKAPKSTWLAVVLLLSLTGAKAAGVLETETYATLAALVIPLAFTDLLRERTPPAPPAE